MGNAEQCTHISLHYVPRLLQRNRNVQVVLESKQVRAQPQPLVLHSLAHTDWCMYVYAAQTVETLKLFADIKKNLDGAIILGRAHKGRRIA